MRKLVPLAVLLALVACKKEHQEPPTGHGFDKRGQTATRTPEPVVIGNEVGQSVGEYSALELDGSKFELGSRRGKVVLLNLWATWCGPCRYEIPELETLHKRYASRGFEVIGVSVDEVGAEAVKSFVEEQKMTYPVVLDPEGKLANVLQTSMLPTSVLVDRNGKIVWKKVGAIEPQDLELESAIVKAL